MIFLISLIIILIGLLFLYWFGSIQDCESTDYIIILGAGLYGERISSSLKRRLDVALRYASEHSNKIIVTGGQGRGETIAEALAMKRYLINKGINEADIIVEATSTSTYTNFLNTKQILNTNKVSLMVTTCDFHMFRAILIGRRVGFTCYRNPARSTQIKCIKYYLRELLCLIKYTLIRK